MTLKRLAPRIVLALDADAAGDAAALRTLEVIRGTYGKIATPVADRLRRLSEPMKKRGRRMDAKRTKR